MGWGWTGGGPQTPGPTLACKKGRGDGDRDRMGVGMGLGLGVGVRIGLAQEFERSAWQPVPIGIPQVPDDSLLDTREVSLNPD